MATSKEIFNNFMGDYLKAKAIHEAQAAQERDKIYFKEHIDDVLQMADAVDKSGNIVQYQGKTYDVKKPNEFNKALNIATVRKAQVYRDVRGLVTDSPISDIEATIFGAMRRWGEIGIKPFETLLDLLSDPTKKVEKKLKRLRDIPEDIFSEPTGLVDINRTE